MQLEPDPRQVLLVAAPNDTQASALLMGLRASGINILLANTIALASRADEFAACIILLRPGQWRTTSAISTAMRCNPRSLIPVLAEPMSLPSASWSTEAINVKEALSETVHELEVIINNQIHIASKNAYTDQKRQKASKIWRFTTYKTRMRIGAMEKYVPIVLLLVLLSGFLFYQVTHKTPASQLMNTPSGGNPIPPSALGQNYTVNVPGGCNATDKDWWVVGTHFTTLETPPDTNTSPKETPTSHVVIDPSTVKTCQQDGLYVQHNDHYDVFANVFFLGNGNETLPQHFSTQITATALNPSNTATFMLGVRQQPNNGSDDHGYGNYSLFIGVNGSWQTVRVNDATGQAEEPFSSGFVEPSRIVTLRAEVDGSHIAFSINGQEVSPIVDTTYPNGYGITFGLSDGNAMSPPSALYSNFSYLPVD